MTSLLAPGGRLYLVEFHPITEIFGDDDLTVENDYFHQGRDWPEEAGTYTEPRRPRCTTHGGVAHPIGKVVSALAARGLRIEFLHEHDYTLYPRWPQLRRESGRDLPLPARGAVAAADVLARRACGLSHCLWSCMPDHGIPGPPRNPMPAAVTAPSSIP